MLVMQLFAQHYVYEFYNQILYNFCRDLQINFEKISTETLESLSEYFDELVEKAAHLQDADVSCGVSTIVPVDL